MRIKCMPFGKWPAYSALSFFCVAGLAIPQYLPAQTVDDDRTVQARDDRREEVARFDRFLDSHREIAEQLKQNPSLVNDPKFVRNHPALQDYLKQHPGVSDALRDNPNAFMRQEDRFDRQEAFRDRDANRDELARFDQFLDQHRGVAKQLQKDPSLVNNAQYLKDHPDLQAYLQQHPEVRQQIQNDPNAFMQREEQFANTRGDDANRSDRDRSNRDRDDRNIADRDATNRSDQDRERNADRDRDAAERDRATRDRQDRNVADRDATNRSDQDRDRNADRDRESKRRELAQFDRFLDGHRETAEQLRKDPSLLDNRQFLKDHPALQSYLQDHPEAREQVKQDPNAFMRQEERYDRREDAMNRQDHDRDAMNREATNRGDRDTMDRDRDQHNNMERFDHDGRHDRAANFGQFLGEHSNIAEQLSRNPALAKDKDYLRDHPELQSYLTAHPEVRQELMANPQKFVKSAQQFNQSHGTTGQGVKSPTGAPSTSMPSAADPKTSKPPVQ